MIGPFAFAWFGSLFGALAGACAFIIAYAEYRRHYPDKRRPLLLSAEMAVAAFAFFFIASLLLPWLLRFAGIGAATGSGP